MILRHARPVAIGAPIAAQNLRISAEASRKSRVRSHQDDELLLFILFRFFKVIVLPETRVDCLDGDAKAGGDFSCRNASIIPRAYESYFLVGELALGYTGGGMMVYNRFLGRRSIVVVAFDIDGKIGRRKQSRFTLGHRTGAPGSIGTLAPAVSDDVEDTGRCESQDVPENAGLGGRN